MVELMKPDIRPSDPHFSSGPTAKRKGWSLQNFNEETIGRSHRSKIGKLRLAQAIDLTRKVLNIPKDYLIAIVPGSNTGAFEMAMWNLLGQRGVDVLAWESFGIGWITDIVEQLKIEDVRVMKSDYGHLPDLSSVDCSRDVVFAWNGTTSGVCVPNDDWIDTDRAGLTLCDATSVVFAVDLPWDKLDVTTYSWQKVLGGEAAHGMIILSPRAVSRLESYQPSWPLPKIFRLTKGQKIIEGIFRGDTINTPSMLAVEDYLDALKWADMLGGVQGLILRVEENCKRLNHWVEHTEWVDFLCVDVKNRSNTSVCLKIIDECVTTLSVEKQMMFEEHIVALLEAEGVAYDIGSYRKAPVGLRIWMGATVESENIDQLVPWLDWAFAKTLVELSIKY